jgi:hypothetical protein
MQVKQVLGVELASFEPKYLGLPTPSGRMKKDRFQSLKERLGKVEGLHRKEYVFRSKGGAYKISSASIANLYSVFQLPLALCDSMTSIIIEFWWGTENGKRKMVWAAWESLVQKKCHGGLGFKDLRLFNQELVARQAWRIIDNSDSLCIHLLRARYFPRGC